MNIRGTTLIVPETSETALRHPTMPLSITGEPDQIYCRLIPGSDDGISEVIEIPARTASHRTAAL